MCAVQWLALSGCGHLQLPRWLYTDDVDHLPWDEVQTAVPSLEGLKQDHRHAMARLGEAVTDKMHPLLGELVSIALAVTS